MASHVEVFLDTTPPQLTVTTYARSEHELAIGYELDEPEVTSAMFEPSDGGDPLPVTVEPTRLVLVGDGRPGVVRVNVRDSVWNVGEYVVDAPAWTFGTFDVTVTDRARYGMRLADRPVTEMDLGDGARVRVRADDRPLWEITMIDRPRIDTDLEDE